MRPEKRNAVRISPAVQDDDLRKIQNDDLWQETQGKRMGSLVREYVAPPFSVLDARSARWQNRLSFWSALGVERGTGCDPVLCELMLRWFCPRGGVVLNYAGAVGSIVAETLGHPCVDEGEGTKADFLLMYCPPDANLPANQFILSRAARPLAESRFACIVAQDEYVRCLERDDMHWYNDAVRITGTWTRFDYVLIFVRGDPKKAAAACKI